MDWSSVWSLFFRPRHHFKMRWDLVESCLADPSWNETSELMRLNQGSMKIRTISTCPVAKWTKGCCLLLLGLCWEAQGSAHHHPFLPTTCFSSSSSFHSLLLNASCMASAWWTTMTGMTLAFMEFTFCGDRGRERGKTASTGPAFNSFVPSKRN